MSDVEENVRFRKSVYYVLSFVFVLWFVKALEFATSADFSSYGIFPRTLHGSIGILTSPLIHGDIYHLISNTFPVLILGIGILYYYPRIGLQVIFLIYIMTGFWVWVAAREAFHIGASGIVYGMFAFLLTAGFIRRDRRTLSVSFILLFVYGSSMFSGLFPTTASISWESHLMGFVAGLLCAFYFRSEPIVFAADETVIKDQEGKAENSSAINHTSENSTSYTYTFVPKGKSVLNNK